MSYDQRSTEATDRSTEVTDDRSTPPQRQRLELSIPQLLAGGLAAASAAVVASWLGVAGTVTGAVVASIVAAVSTALYKHSLERSSQVIRETLPVLPVLPDRYRNAHLNGNAHLDHAGSETAKIGARRPPRPRSGASPTAARRIRWGAVAVSAVLTLIVGFGMLTVVEGVLGKPVEGGGGRFTVDRILGHGGSNHSDNTKPKTPAPSSTSTSDTSSVPSTTAPDTTGTTEPPPTTTAPPDTTPPASSQPPASEPPTTTGPS